jgi:hypothetical protein
VKIEVSEGKSEVVSQIAELLARMPTNALIIIYTCHRTIAHTAGGSVFDTSLGCGTLAMISCGLTRPGTQAVLGVLRWCLKVVTRHISRRCHKWTCFRTSTACHLWEGPSVVSSHEALAEMY